MYANIKSWMKKGFSANNDRSVLFYRNFLGFQGGHLKTWNYFQHLEELQGFSPTIYFSKTSVWKDNPWKDSCAPEKQWNPAVADILFLAGLDWSALKDYQANKKQPIINLIQAVRHADPEDIRYSYLKKKAIRICVSEEVADALHKSKQVNGPIFTIPNGIDLHSALDNSVKVDSRKYDVVISGLKNKPLAKKIESKLIQKNIKVECLLDNVPRDLYLNKLASARVSLLLPAKKEGFYLPALESMGMATLTICPDCVGNRKFCKPAVNCFMPEYDYNSLVEKTVMALNMKPEDYNKMIREALLTSEDHSLKEERRSFYKIMNNIDQIW